MRSNHSMKTSHRTMRDTFRGKHPRRAREVKANEYPRKVAMTKQTKGMKEKKRTPCGRPESYWNKQKKSVCSTSRNCSPGRTTRMQRRLGHCGEANVHGFTAPLMYLIESPSFAVPISPLVIEIN